VEEKEKIKKERVLKKQKHQKNQMKRRNKKRKSKKLKKMFQKEPQGDKRKKLITLLLQRSQSAPTNEQEDSDCFFRQKVFFMFLIIHYSDNRVS